MLILIILEKGMQIVFSANLCVIFQENLFSWYLLLAEQISLPDYLNLLRYWVIHVLYLFIFQVVVS